MFSLDRPFRFTSKLYFGFQNVFLRCGITNEFRLLYHERFGSINTVERVQTSFLNPFFKAFLWLFWCFSLTWWYPNQSSYRPGFWQLLKHAWIQYLAILFIFIFIFGHVKLFIYENRLVATIIKKKHHNDWSQLRYCQWMIWNKWKMKIHAYKSHCLGTFQPMVSTNKGLLKISISPGWILK